MCYHRKSTQLPKIWAQSDINHEWTQTRTGAGPGHWPAIDVLLGTGVFAVPALAALVAGNTAYGRGPF